MRTFRNDSVNPPLAESLSRRLRWSEVSERRTEPFGLRTFDILPRTAGLPSISLLLAPQTLAIVQVGFSQWHSHYESSGSFLREQATALRDVKRLVRQLTCVVEQLDGSGRYLASTLSGLSDLPYAVAKGTVTLRRVVFDGGIMETLLPAIYEEGPLYLERRYAGA